MTVQAGLTERVIWLGVFANTAGRNLFFFIGTQSTEPVAKVWVLAKYTTKLSRTLAAIGLVLGGLSICLKIYWGKVE